MLQNFLDFEASLETSFAANLGSKLYSKKARIHFSLEADKIH